MDDAREKIIEEKTGIVFQDKALLHRAFVHRSFLNERKDEKESNERLEFLGDAVLEFLVSTTFIFIFPAKTKDT